MKIILLLLALLLSGCAGPWATSKIYTPDIAEIASGPPTMLHLPTNADIWAYQSHFIVTFLQRADLDAGVDFGGTILDALVSSAAAGVAIAHPGSNIIAYMAGAEGLLRRLLSIANPVVRGNALSNATINIRNCRASFLENVVAEQGDHTPLSSAGVAAFRCTESSVNLLIAALQGSQPSLIDQLQATPLIMVPVTGGGVKLQAPLPMPKQPTTQNTGGQNANTNTISGSQPGSTLIPGAPNQ